jgi:hexokinase
MKLAHEFELTVVTAGTPVPITAYRKAAAVVVANNYPADDTRIVMVGLLASVDALSTPPVGSMIGTGVNGQYEVNYDSSQLAIDASVSGTKVTVQVYE